LYKTRIDLANTVRDTSVAVLQASLADAVDLFTQIKQAHWNVKGPNFIALHELFDKIAEIIEGHSDDIAERITALGGRADGTARVAAQSSLNEYPLEMVEGGEHLAAVADKLAAFGKSMRAAIDSSAESGDADTSDVFTGISREVDKQLWFVEAHLQAQR
jgi:starvation-inducible DNA-binding protein